MRGRWVAARHLRTGDTLVTADGQEIHLFGIETRAKAPGKFHALPTSATAMYAPEIRAISDEIRLEVRE